MRTKRRFTINGRTCAPLITGGMGVDISTSELAVQIARLGGIGHISDAMGPYVADKRYRTHFQASKSKKFGKPSPDANTSDAKWDPSDVYAAQRLQVSRTMEQKRPQDGAIFINVMEKLTMGDPKPTLKARLEGALDAGVDGITLSAGLHLGTLELIENHERLRDVALGIIVSSARALKIFLRSAKKSDRLPDYVVVEGPLAGGHLGFGMDWREFTLDAIFTEVQTLLTDSGLQIPIIPAGGIFTSEDAISYLDRGAAAVQVATRFVVSEECGLPPDVKQTYAKAKEEEVVVNLVSPTGYPMRMLSGSPCLKSNVRPNCEALGYMLDAHGKCSYREAYSATPIGPDGEKQIVESKMCICHHFMRHQCYTCGHNVFRLKDTLTVGEDGLYRLPPASEIFADYTRLM